MATISDVNSATQTAKEKRGINDLPGRERVEIFERAAVMLEKHRDEFVHVLQTEAGKTKSDAKGEFDATVQRLRLSREESDRFWGELIPGDWNFSTRDKMALTIREPCGHGGRHNSLQLSPFYRRHQDCACPFWPEARWS